MIIPYIGLVGTKISARFPFLFLYAFLAASLNFSFLKFLLFQFMMFEKFHKPFIIFKIVAGIEELHQLLVSFCFVKT